MWPIEMLYAISNEQLIADTISEKPGIIARILPYLVIVPLLAFIYTRIDAHRKKKKELKAWWSDVISSADYLGASMGVSKINLILDNISRVANNSLALAENPVKLLEENIDSVWGAANKLDSVLRVSDKKYADLVLFYKEESSRIIRQYRDSCDDICVIARLSEANGFDEMRAIIEKEPASDNLRLSFDAACDSQTSFDRGRIIKDIIGLAFIDEEIPDYELQLKQLTGRFGESLLSSAFLSRGRIWKGHSSAEAKYEKAEGYLEEGLVEDAFRWFQKAADEDYPESQFRLGECYEFGKGCSPNPELSMFWYEKAAEKGLTIAEFHAGLCYRFGIGCDQDIKRATEYIKRAADKGYLEAIYELGSIYRSGGDVRKGDNLIRKAASKGCADAQNELSKILYRKLEYDESLKWARMAAENGVREAMVLCGTISYAKPDEPSRKEAFYWTRKAAEMGDALGQYNLGMFYKWGVGCEIDKIASADWIEKSATAGNTPAQYEIGACYFNACGRKRDTEKAEYWFNQAIKNNFAEAFLGIGMIRFDARKYGEAISYLTIAADQGCSFAMDQLSICYEHGLGTKANPALAACYKEKARKIHEASKGSPQFYLLNKTSDMLGIGIQGQARDEEGDQA